jgi:hypothetical protein
VKLLLRVACIDFSSHREGAPGLCQCTIIAKSTNLLVGTCSSRLSGQLDRAVWGVDLYTGLTLWLGLSHACTSYFLELSIELLPIVWASLGDYRGTSLIKKRNPPRTTIRPEATTIGPEA